ncbi:MAG: HAD family hydrolase [Methylovirgula sp.]
MSNLAHHQLRSFAFFDVDDTIITIKSMFDFFRYWCLLELKDEEKHLRFKDTFDRLRRAGEGREELNRTYYRFFTGVFPDVFETAGRRWFAWAERKYPDLINRPVFEALRQHISRGVRPVFVSGSCEALLRPLAKKCGVNDILAAPLLLSEDGSLSGELGEPQTIGEGKKRAIETFLRLHEGHAETSYAYGDDISDLPMLESVGRPVAVGNGGPLVDIAILRGWERISFTPPKATNRRERANTLASSKIR